MNDPVISVIMGTYNPDISKLKSAVDSIIKQTEKSWEMIIYDDGSTEAVSENIREICAYDDRLIYCKGETNKGLAHCLNEAFKLSKGRFIARMDDDDESLAKRFEIEREFLENNPEYGWVGCIADLFDNTGVWGRAQRAEKPEASDFLPSSPFIHPSVMFRREVLEECNGYREDKLTARCEDYELFMRLYSLGKKGFNIQTVLFKYREDSKKLKRSMKYCANEMKIRRQGFKKLGIYNLKNGFYVVKPILVGLISKFPVLAQKIRTGTEKGDHIVKSEQ
ncbi:MAG: glycosyltransferase [Clostridia bacterium]|nr:glycosyltransferase [Clostridia bacterium]